MFKFSFCSYTVFLILLNYPSVFYCSSPSFLKTLLWILYQVNPRSPYLWEHVLEDYCDHLVVSCFLDFSFTWSFPCCLPIIPPTDFEAFSDHQWIYMLHASYSLLWQNSSSYMPSPDPVTQQARSSFCFPKDGGKFQTCCFSLAHRFGPAFCACSLSVC